VRQWESRSKSFEHTGRLGTITAAAQLERRKRKAREVRAMAGGDATEDGGGVRRSDALAAGAEPSSPADDECGAGRSLSTAYQKKPRAVPPLGGASRLTVLG